MLPNIAKLQPMLERMTGPQLQQFAAMHHDDAVAVGLAMQIDKDRKEEVARLQGLMSGQKQPTVIDQAMQALGNPQQPIQGGPQGGAPMPPPGGSQGQMPPQGMPPQGPPGMQMPPQAPPAPQGVAALPAPNMQGMADGGIAGYADEDEAVGYADGGVVHMQTGGTPEDAAIRAQGKLLGLSDETIDRVIEGRKLQAPQTQLPFTPAATSGVGVPQFKEQNLGEAMPMPTPVPNPRMTGETPAIGPNDRNPLITREQSPSSGIAPTRTNLGNATDRLPDLRQFSTDLEAGRIRAVPGGGIVPMTPGQGSFKDRSLGNREPAEKAVAAATPTNYEAMYRAMGMGNAPAAVSAGAVPRAGLASLVGAGGPPTLTPPQALTPKKAMENVGQFFNPKDLYAQADKARAEALGRAEETAQFVKLNKPAAPFKKLAEKLDTEEFDEAGEKEKAKGMAIMMAGLKMMESPYGGKGLGAALRNIGAGAIAGAKELQQSNKEFKELAQKRMQMRTTIEAAQNAAERGDFDREIALRTRADQIEDSANNNRMRIGETLFNAKGTAALTAFNHSADVIDKYKFAEFGAKTDVYTTQMREAGATTRHAQSEAGATARSNAQIAAQRQSDLFKASLPPEAIRAAGYLGGAPPGTLPTPAQVKAGLEITNSEKFNPQAAYSKYLTDWKKDQADMTDRRMTYPEYLAMFGAGKVIDKLPANALVRNPQ